MRTTRAARLAVVLTSALLATLGLASAAAAADLAIVVNPATPVTQLTFAELRQVFMGDRQYWTRDMPVVLLVRAPTSAERDAVLRVIYQMRDAQFKQYWIAKVFRADTASPPKIVNSNELTRQLVATIPGAIAFVPQADVRPDMKVLRIDGHLPGEAGYKLHLTGQ